MIVILGIREETLKGLIERIIDNLKHKENEVV